MIRILGILVSAVVIIIPPAETMNPDVNSLWRDRGHRMRSGGGDVPPFSAPLTYQPSSTTPLVTLRLVFRCGSQDDPPGKEGLAALTAAVVAGGGLRGLLREQLTDRFYPLAADLSAECRTETTVLVGTVHTEVLTRYLPLCVSLLASPRFDPDDFHRLKHEAIDRLSGTIHDEDAGQLARRALQVGLYRGHPYGHVAAGTVAGLAAITLDDVRQFYQAHYNRASLRLGVAGAADRRMLDFIRGQLGFVPPGTFRDTPLPRPDAPRGTDVTLVESPAETTAIALGFPLDLPPRDDDLDALAVAEAGLVERLHVLGEAFEDDPCGTAPRYGPVAEGPASALFPDDPRRQPAVALVLRAGPRDAVFALKQALRELDRLVREGLTDTEFESACAALRNAAAVSGRTAAVRLGQAMDTALLGRDDSPDELARRLAKLSVAQVNAAIRRHLAVAGVKVVIVTRDPAAIRSALLSAASPSPVRGVEGRPKRLPDERRSIAAPPLPDLHVRVVGVGELFGK